MNPVNHQQEPGHEDQEEHRLPDSAHHQEQRQEPTTRSWKSQLLPRPAEMLRRGIPLSNAYGNSSLDRDSNFSNDDKCSCLMNSSSSVPLNNMNQRMKNRRSRQKKCCVRRVGRYHKMGMILLRGLFGNKNHNYTRQEYIGLSPPNYLDPKQQFLFRADFRIALVARNIYQSLISGYLYHKYV